MLSLKKSTKPKEWDYKPLLIIIALVYLALLLFIPAAAVFYYAFRNGAGATTDTPEVRPTRSSRTKVRSSQASNDHIR